MNLYLVSGFQTNPFPESMNSDPNTNKTKLFETNIQKWVSLDNQLKLLQEKTKELREQKQILNKRILEYTEENSLTNATIQISDGKLRFTNTRVAAPLTYKFLEKSLGEIIPNPQQVEKIMNYLKEKRDFKVVSEIRRFQG
jgi:uncharacterized coiled-coil DUF342 family protein